MSGEHKDEESELNSDEELDPSVLGTIDHWKKEYSESIERFEDYGDIGEIWFGRDCMKRIVRWMSSSNLVSKSDNIVDLGCGNAALLIDLVSSFPTLVNYFAVHLFFKQSNKLISIY
ncbi:EEF1A lysine methyltransferase 2-like [Diaphorina citri]|uniref:EEF1A lysine methyltransferase 2-like n=1 Tax=Diaphorina citri TaxID=121845 RepID=A0A1S3DEB9_DIACI|nr:EEF1A lysine methyltransferase 2-like [Diaphorina citri]